MPSIMSKALESKPPTYGDLWDDYAAGKLSTCTMRHLLETDEVFKAWCVRKAAAERQERDRRASEDDGA